VPTWKPTRRKRRKHSTRVSTYRRMREAGASRYLLRIETTNTDLYHKIHPRDELHSFETRVECLRRLRRVGFQVGTGVNLPASSSIPIAKASWPRGVS